MREGSRVSKRRTFITVFVSGFFCMFAFAALDGEWPDYSAAKWLIFVGGLVVLALVFIAVEALFLARGQDS